jgi:hypothetical protein
MPDILTDRRYDVCVPGCSSRGVASEGPSGMSTLDRGMDLVTAGIYRDEAG